MRVFLTIMLLFLISACNVQIGTEFKAIEVGRNKDKGTLRHQQVSMLKRNSVWVARECAKLAREIHGGNGITGDYPIMRHLMNIESVYTYEGTHDMHTLILGNDITDIPSYQ